MQPESNTASLTISRILHAGYLLEYDGVRIAFDTIFENPFSGNCYAYPSVKFDQDSIRRIHLDAVFISHYHDDHLSFDSLILLDRQTPIFLYCIFSEMVDWLRLLGFNNVYSLKLNETIVIGDFKVKVLPALDEDVDSIFHIQIANLNILNVVDSWISPDTLGKLLKTKNWNLVLWPFQTMRELEVLAPTRNLPNPPQVPSEWLEQLAKLQPAYLVPSSCQFINEDWSWYNHAFFPLTYEQFSIEMAKILPASKVQRMSPGESFCLTHREFYQVGRLPWVLPIGPQDVDYKYLPEIVPPTTAEIAKNFVKLSDLQRSQVEHFCTKKISEKWSNLVVLADGYFNEPKKWCLVLFEEQGAALEYYYEICKDKMHLLNYKPPNVDWYTELPIRKLYNAMYAGEALTSLYLRINSIILSKAAEARLSDIDIGEDPLIRCLYEGEFGSYQKAQLRIILESINLAGQESFKMNSKFYEFNVNKIDGKATTLSAYKGKVLLVVNVASKCGLTPQYAALEQVYEKYSAKGFEVLGFPANEFEGQEPGTNAEIQDFCKANFGVKFSMFEKIVVKGGGQHPLYSYLTSTKPEAQMIPGQNFEEKLNSYGIVRENKHDILWNFEKFLIGKEGQVLARFAPDVTPDHAIVVDAIEAALKA